MDPDDPGGEGRPAKVGGKRPVPIPLGKPAPRWKAPGPDDPMWAKASRMWHLDLSNPCKEYAWWWWWQLVLMDPPDKESNPRQLMILWSTKNCDRIEVNGYDWRRKGTIEETEDGYRFNGMTCAWYYDGRHMHDPLVLEESNYTMKRLGGAPDHKGILETTSKHDYTFKGKRDDYRLNIINDEVDLRFRFTPMSREMTTHRYKENIIKGKFTYNIHKIYGMRADCRLKVKGEGDPSSRHGYRPIHSPGGFGTTEEMTGTSYFQKLLVNAPATPWLWGIFHMDDGSYVDYMIPHVGLGIFRKHTRPRSPLDRGKIKIRRHMEFYDAQQDRRYELKTKVRMEYQEGLGLGNKLELMPIFHVTAKNDEGCVLKMTLEAYSRATWRFKQPFLGVIPTVLFYNEYPSHMTAFEFTGPNGHRITRDRWKTVYGNCEYSWGFLL